MWGLRREEGGSRVSRQGGSAGRPLSSEARNSKATRQHAVLPPGDALLFPRGHKQAEQQIVGLTSRAPGQSRAVRRSAGWHRASGSGATRRAHRDTVQSRGVASRRENTTPSEELQLWRLERRFEWRRCPG